MACGNCTDLISISSERVKHRVGLDSWQPKYRINTIGKKIGDYHIARGLLVAFTHRILLVGITEIGDTADADSKKRQCPTPTVHIIDLLDQDKVFVEFAHPSVKSIKSV